MLFHESQKLHGKIVLYVYDDHWKEVNTNWLIGHNTPVHYFRMHAVGCMNSDLMPRSGPRLDLTAFLTLRLTDPAFVVENKAIVCAPAVASNITVLPLTENSAVSSFF